MYGEGRHGVVYGDCSVMKVNIMCCVVVKVNYIVVCCAMVVCCGVW